MRLTEAQMKEVDCIQCRTKQAQEIKERPEDGSRLISVDFDYRHFMFREDWWQQFWSKYLKDV